MLESLEAYKETLEYTKNFQSKTKGYSLYDPQSSSDKIIIRQNNTIIRLLVTLHEKFDILRTPKKNCIEDELNNLIQKQETLNLKNTGKEIVSRKPKNIFKFPKQGIR